MYFKNSILVAMSGIILGIAIAIVFGVNEDLFKNKIEKGILLNPKYSKIENKNEFLKKEASKNWRYYQRFHFHASAIGTMSLALLLLINFTSAPGIRKKVLCPILAISGFLYPFVWLFAGIYGPEWGRTEAKEFFAVFGYMGGVYLVTIIWVFIEVVKTEKFLTKIKS
ncbi:MAG: hypothetical protein ACJAS4_000168 [Bacteriovoracaceae bacterium]|jgi:hypothetical protein